MKFLLNDTPLLTTIGKDFRLQASEKHAHSTSANAVLFFFFFSHSRRAARI